MSENPYLRHLRVPEPDPNCFKYGCTRSWKTIEHNLSTGERSCLCLGHAINPDRIGTWDRPTQVRV